MGAGRFFAESVFFQRDFLRERLFFDGGFAMLGQE